MTLFVVSGAWGAVCGWLFFLGRRAADGKRYVLLGAASGVGLALVLPMLAAAILVVRAVIRA